MNAFHTTCKVCQVGELIHVPDTPFFACDACDVVVWPHPAHASEVSS